MSRVVIWTFAQVIQKSTIVVEWEFILLWGSVAAACNQVALKEMKGFHAPHDLGQVC